MIRLDHAYHNFGKVQGTCHNNEAQLEIHYRDGVTQPPFGCFHQKGTLRRHFHDRCTALDLPGLSQQLKEELGWSVQPFLECEHSRNH